ncbi:hypothetical protein GWI33_001565 [Rhynchophorus ferrugineus]|uniref:Uncharacterized protein n=1 Tax=Rhynchophorus ferrugineus TaxID=354439 RepID=A0A834MLQ8_RHYFE|nr:hypothetical protein GWI33_001565 [Rhynchophorus ferrugineus]
MVCTLSNEKEENKYKDRNVIVIAAAARSDRWSPAPALVQTGSKYDEGVGNINKPSDGFFAVTCEGRAALRRHEDGPRRLIDKTNRPADGEP